MKKIKFIILVLFSFSLFASTSQLHQVKLKVKSQQLRDELANIIPIDFIAGDIIETSLNDYDYKILKEKYSEIILEEKAYDLPFQVGGDEVFPAGYEGYHTYKMWETYLDKVVAENPGLFHKITLGKSLQGQELWGVQVGEASKNKKDEKPLILITGLHHAREHLSTDVAIRLVRFLAEEAPKLEAWKKFFNSREIVIVPLLNPDGGMFDISGGQFHSWRKNRSANRGGTSGVDLNRNYSYKWGTGGSSADGSSDVYMGPNPFSEPETQAVKKFVETHSNLKMILSLHTFSELILYPWGHTHEGVGGKDQKVFETMANAMAKMNGYTPKQSSGLYIASGDTCDWAYGEHHIFCFTFELYPSRYDIFTGFYPKPKFIETTFQKNLSAIQYLIEHTDDPYRALK